MGDCEIYNAITNEKVCDAEIVQFISNILTLKSDNNILSTLAFPIKAVTTDGSFAGTIKKIDTSKVEGAGIYMVRQEHILDMRRYLKVRSNQIEKLIADNDIHECKLEIISYTACAFSTKHFIANCDRVGLLFDSVDRFTNIVLKNVANIGEKVEHGAITHIYIAEIPTSSLNDKKGDFLYNYILNTITKNKRKETG